MTARLRGERGNALFGVIVGFAAGVLVAALVVPDRGSSSVLAGGSGGSAGGTAGGGALVVGPGQGPSSEGGAVSGGGGAGPDSGSTTEGSAGQDGGAAVDGGPVRGVTDDKIRIGIALLELGALKNLGPSFDNGDRRQHFESILDGWRQRGLVPIHGRDVEFVYRSYGPISPEEQRAACKGLVQDENVFMVIADSTFNAGIECVTREFRTLLVTSDAPPDDVFQRGAPYVFTLQPSLGRTLRNYVHWAHHRGALSGKKIGLYYFDDAVTRDLMDRTVKAELSNLGYSVAAEQTTTQNLGGPADALAVQRFRTAGVDVAMLFTSKAGFMQNAQAQAYRPAYLENDFLSGTTNTATSTYPAEQFDGTYGMSGMRYGEWKAGLPTPAEAEACLADYERFSGKRIDPNAREAEYVGLNKGCDDARLVIQALQGAGPGLTPAGVVAQLELLQGVTMGVHGVVSFGAGKHDGIDQHRTVQWTADCKCWKALGSFEPLFVP